MEVLPLNLFLHLTGVSLRFTLAGDRYVTYSGFVHLQPIDSYANFVLTAITGRFLIWIKPCVYLNKSLLAVSFGFFPSIST